MLKKQEIWDNITKNGDNIVIVTHPTPDGDALGSAFALACALEAAGKTPVVILDKFSAKYNFLCKQRFLYDGDTAALNCDVLIAVDCGGKSRISCAADLFDRAKITVNIDHHINNDNFATYNYVDHTASSACEVVFDIINMHVPIGKEIAEAIYTGIVTDTAAFRHSNTSPRTLEIAAELMRFGIDFGEIQRKVFYTRTKAEAAIFAKALQNIKFADNSPIVYSTLTPEEMQTAGATYADLDGIVNFLLDIEGTAAAALFTKRGGGQTKVNLRSLGPDVSIIAAQFGGGGHKFAAAAQFEADFDEGIQRVVAALAAACEL